MASHSAQSLVASLSGKKVAIMSYGSRGDIQPFVALGTRLQAEGAHVLLATNVDHLDFVRSFGLEVSATAGSCRADHESPEFLRGIATGDFGPFFAQQFQEKAAKMPETSKKEQEAVEAFGPDLLYATPLTYQSACRISSALGVPMVLGSLFLAAVFHADLNSRPLFDALWMAGLFVGVLAVIPQFWLISRTSGSIEALTSHFIAMMAMSRVLSGIFMWHVREDLTCDAWVGSFNHAVWAILGAHLLHLLLLGDFVYYYVKSVATSGLAGCVEVSTIDIV
mmetsp:Transcript_117023/g.327468  ORF Transcript_117023/g.327468 Transcript_117023/m.327468 type:complete len:280 (-) Transcript_117023:120-959(-)